MKCWQDDTVVCMTDCELFDTCPEIDRITGRLELTPEEEEKIFKKNES
ncbi:MAG: hypothetical protein MJ134_07665 [Lachnospiraceae bacterium]|nr:hypothetical protein [Lachnospiraceae bacterium]